MKSLEIPQDFGGYELNTRWDDAASPGDEGLVNVSTRGSVGRGKPYLLGFVIRGNGKRLLVRAAGASLAGFGIGDPLERSQITLVAADGRKVAFNSGLAALSAEERDEVQVAVRNVASFALSGTDAAVVVQLNAGAYSVIVESADGGEGTVLAEVYGLGQ